MKVVRMLVVASLIVAGLAVIASPAGAVSSGYKQWGKRVCREFYSPRRSVACVVDAEASMDNGDFHIEANASTNGFLKGLMRVNWVELYASGSDGVWHGVALRRNSQFSSSGVIDISTGPVAVNIDKRCGNSFKTVAQFKNVMSGETFELTSEVEATQSYGGFCGLLFA